MFGLGKIFDSVFGKFFDSIGLGWLSTAIQLTANIMSGNWAAAAKDVFDLVARFSNNEWMDRVASFQPLGDFDIGGCFSLDSLAESTINSWMERLGLGDNPDLRNFVRAIYIAADTIQNNNVAMSNLRLAQANEPV